MLCDEKITFHSDFYTIYTYYIFFCSIKWNGINFETQEQKKATKNGKQYFIIKKLYKLSKKH